MYAPPVHPADTEGVHAIANTEKPERIADIVFVHGLGGKSHSTWKNNNGFFWPEELGKELPQCGVWSLGYEADISQVTGSGMVIGLRAMSIASLLTNAEIGTERPVVFVTHSMGGLVVKALVDGCRQNTDPDAEKLVRNVGGIGGGYWTQRGSRRWFLHPPPGLWNKGFARRRRRQARRQPQHLHEGDRQVGFPLHLPHRFLPALPELHG